MPQAVEKIGADAVVNYLGASPRGIRKEKTVKFRGKPRSILNLDYRVNVRFNTSQVMQGAAEMLTYGTAVKLK